MLDTRLALAGVRVEAGDVVGATEAYEHLWADMMRVLGEDHRGTRWTRQKLGRWWERRRNRCGAGTADIQG